MNTIPKKPDDRNLQYLQFVELQRHEPTKAEIATHFDRDSAEAVFRELKGHGFPVCVVCGATPVVGAHCRPDGADAELAGGDLGGGLDPLEALELPAAANATSLLKSTKRLIEADLMVTPGLTEILTRDGLFVGEGAAGCRAPGPTAGVGQWFPHPSLTRLIGSHIVETGGSWNAVERLLEVLHPTPTQANRKQLDKYIWGRPGKGDGLIERICQVAALIRGAPERKRGPRPSSLTPSQQLQNMQEKRDENAL